MRVDVRVFMCVHAHVCMCLRVHLGTSVREFYLFCYASEIMVWVRLFVPESACFV